MGRFYTYLYKDTLVSRIRETTTLNDCSKEQVFQRKCSWILVLLFFPVLIIGVTIVVVCLYVRACMHVCACDLGE
jgi:hypothetical protein